MPGAAGAPGAALVGDAGVVDAIVKTGQSSEARAADADAGRKPSRGASAKLVTPAPLPRGQEILLIGGFMSELYESLSLNLERELNDSLREAARSLNVHIDLPLDHSIDIHIGDHIAQALPWFSLPLEPGGFVTFHTQEQLFEAHGIDHRNLARISHAFNSSESIAHNAAAIRAFLNANAKTQFIIVTHSKGGLDTLHALLDAEHLWGKTVIGWIALQAPFHGSPIADPSPSTINDVMLNALGGNGRSVFDLRTSTRADYMQANARRIAALTARIPTISAYSTYEGAGTAADFASTYAKSILDAQLVSEITKIVVANYRNTPEDIPGVITRSTSEAVSLIRTRVTEALRSATATIGLMDLTNVYMRAVLHQPNDGLVPKGSTLLPGADHRALAVGDHASPVMDVDPFKNFWTVGQRDETTWSLIQEVRRLASEPTRNVAAP